MNKRVTTAAIALALGLAWTAVPASAQQTTTEKVKDKAETVTDKIKEKATDIKDKIHDKGAAVKDKLESKTHRDKDKAEDAAKSTADKADSKMDSTKGKMHRMGSKTDVVAMQQALKDKGHDPGPADGRIGPRTRAALRDYQKKEGLNPTGRWDEETGNRLGVRMSTTTPTDTMHTSTPAASPAMPADKTASPAKRQTP